MKKYIVSLFIFSLGVFSTTAHGHTAFQCFTDQIDATSVVGVESEFVYRGSKLAQFVATPSVEMGATWERARFYTGMWSAAPCGNTADFNAQQVNPYAGVSFDVTNVFSLDGGFTYYWFTNTDAGSSFRTRNSNRHRELYLGITADVMINPAFYGYYNVDLEQWVLEPSLSESIDIEPWVCLPMSLDVGAHAGYLHAHEFNGNQRAAGVPKQKNKYWYFGGKLELVYHFSDCARVGAGPRLAYNTDETLESAPPAVITANSLGMHQLMLWWGMHVTFEL